MFSSKSLHVQPLLQPLCNMSLWPLIPPPSPPPPAILQKIPRTGQQGKDLEVYNVPQSLSLGLRNLGLPDFNVIKHINHRSCQDAVGGFKEFNRKPLKFTTPELCYLPGYLPYGRYMRIWSIMDLVFTRQNWRQRWNFEKWK